MAAEKNPEYALELSAKVTKNKLKVSAHGLPSSRCLESSLPDCLSLP